MANNQNNEFKTVPFTVKPFRIKVSNNTNNKIYKPSFLNDDLEMIKVKPAATQNNQFNEEKLITKISATYFDDYNINYIDDLIRRKLNQELVNIESLRNQYRALEINSCNRQTYIARCKTIEAMDKLKQEIDDLESGQKLNSYNDSAKTLLAKYRQYQGLVKTTVFDLNDQPDHSNLNDDFRDRLYIIEMFLNIAKNYLDLDIIRLTNYPTDCCINCGTSLVNITSLENGIICCPNCELEHDTIITTKSKDGKRTNINTSCDDESIENFLRAFMRYQGLQTVQPPNILYEELDKYFVKIGRPTGKQVKQMPLNDRGRRGQTNHEMLWKALSDIGYSQYYEDINLIGKIYWGWELPDVMTLKETIIDDYHKTQKVFYLIPFEDRQRTSALGTAYRLYRHLQMRGHTCYSSEFKIATNLDSLRNHHKLWQIMCEGADDPNIKYLPFDLSEASFF